MTCYDESTLRAWLDDQPALVAHPLTDIRNHVVQCAACQLVAADLQARSSVAASSIGLLGGPSATDHDVESALAAVRRPRAVADEVPTLERRRRSFARPITAAAAAALVLAVVGTPTGRSAAASFLEQFRSKRIAVIEISEQDEAAFEELAALGEVSGGPRGIRPERVESTAAASDILGFAVAVPDPATIPPGVSRQPDILVSRPQQVRFTLDRARTQAWLAEKKSAVVVPERFDGASLVVAVPAIALQHYAAPDGTPGLVVGQSRQLVVTTEGGVTLEEFRSFLLSLPGLSQETKRQLENIDNWRETLPLPVPRGSVDWEETQIAGIDGLLLGDNTGLGSAGVWQRDGFIYGVAVRGKADQVRDVAAGLR